MKCSLSERGKTLIPLLKQKHDWGEDQIELVAAEAKNRKHSTLHVRLMEISATGQMAYGQEV